MSSPSRTAQTVLYAIVCAAPPALHVRDLVGEAHERGYDLCLIATPTAARWLADDLTDLGALTGHPVRSAYKRPIDPDVLPPPGAVLVAPATFNTLNKWAAGISDTLALGLANEALGLGIPVAAVPCLSDALSAHPALSANLSLLRGAGVSLLHPDPRPAPSAFPWHRALDLLRDRHADR
ncbi:flavoprotein [Actinocorallia sp. B10E7]|uniref:flavoprotein n=1 Tax=Actinocorallia sp. B10E7 TaxID=3153558 RepID=UPI00325DB0E8